MHLHFFPEEFLAFQEEIYYHEDLLIKLLQLPKDSPMEMKLGEVATYCEVVLDGYYDAEAVVNLCKILTKKLRAKRGELVLEVVQSVPPFKT